MTKENTLGIFDYQRRKNMLPYLQLNVFKPIF
jgi:hypothetical protein